METEDIVLTKSDRNWISRQRTRDLQRLFSHLLLMWINHAVEHLNLVAEHREELLDEELDWCLRPLECTKAIIESLSEGRRGFSEGVDMGYFYFDKRDLFNALNKATREKLNSKWMYSDTFDKDGSPAIPTDQNGTEENVTN